MALDFYYAHKDDSAEELVKAVLSNKDMWNQGSYRNQRTGRTDCR